MTQTIPGLEDQTTTLALHTALSSQAQRPLEFWLGGELLVGPGYHVTEVKAVTIEAMDCGGKARYSLNRSKTPVKGLNAVPVNLEGGPGRSGTVRRG